MNPLTVSAQFSAYVWFSHGKPDTQAVRAEANRFAQANWPAFLPNAHRGLGRFLLRLADQPSRRSAQEKLQCRTKSGKQEDLCHAG